jgi:hypothetical protein
MHWFLAGTGSSAHTCWTSLGQKGMPLSGRRLIRVVRAMHVSIYAYCALIVFSFIIGISRGTGVVTSDL